MSDIHRRGLLTAADRKDHYVLALRNAIRTGSEVYLLDRAAFRFSSPDVRHAARGLLQPRSTRSPRPESS